MLTIIKDTDIIIPIRFTTATGEAIDLTGATVYFTIKLKLTAPDSEAICAIDIASHIEPTDGVTRLTIPRIVTKTFPPGKYYFDFKIRRQSIVSGTVPDAVKIVESVTKRDNYG